MNIIFILSVHCFSLTPLIAKQTASESFSAIDRNESMNIGLICHLFTKPNPRLVPLKWNQFKSMNVSLVRLWMWFSYSNVKIPINLVYADWIYSVMDIVSIQVCTVYFYCVLVMYIIYNKVCISNFKSHYFIKASNCRIDANKSLLNNWYLLASCSMIRCYASNFPSMA